MKKKIKVEKTPKIIEMIPYTQFFDQMVFKKKVRSEQRREIELFFASRGLGSKEPFGKYKRCLHLY